MLAPIFPTSESPPIGVIFDMDGVLVDSAAAHLESWRLLAQTLNRMVTAEQFEHSFGQRSREIIQTLFGIHHPEEIERLDAHKESLYRTLIRGRVPIMPGADELLSALHKTPFRLAVGSSGPPENVSLVCDESGWTSILTAVVTGRDVREGKPDPEVFLVAAERLGLQPSDCVVIEDAPIGIEAARRAGMSCIALTSTHPAARLTRANLCVKGLDEIHPDGIRALIQASRA